MFPPNPNLNNQQNTRQREIYKVNFAHRNGYKNSTIPFCQRLLNQAEREEEEEAEGAGEEEEKEGEEEEEEERL